jgi:hypothetical protein
MKGPFLKILKSGALTAIVLMCGLATPAQSVRGCVTTGFVGARPSNPFTAKSVITSTTPIPGGVAKSKVREERVARDSQGRVRIEKHGVGQHPGIASQLLLKLRMASRSR